MPRIGKTGPHGCLLRQRPKGAQPLYFPAQREIFRPACDERVAVRTFVGWRDEESTRRLRRPWNLLAKRRLIEFLRHVPVNRILLLDAPHPAQLIGPARDSREKDEYTGKRQHQSGEMPL